MDDAESPILIRFLLWVSRGNIMYIYSQCHYPFFAHTLTCHTLYIAYSNLNLDPFFDRDMPLGL